MNPRTEALAYRIWAYARPLGWDCTAHDIADALGEPWQRVSRVCAVKGWGNRLRKRERAGEMLRDYLAPTIDPVAGLHNALASRHISDEAQR